LVVEVQFTLVPALFHVALAARAALPAKTLAAATIRGSDLAH